MILKDKKFRVPREWSNRELLKFSHLYRGEVINVSGWKDIDKEGNFYRRYFKNCSKYYISNPPEKEEGFQNNINKNEIKLDLEMDLEDDLIEKFDVVFNHTTLEHIYDFKKAFENLCLLTNDIVIIVVPFLQLEHGEKFKDYWRFTPTAIIKLFKKNGLKTLYINYNEHKRTSIYIFCIATKNYGKWREKFPQSRPKRKEIYFDTYFNTIGSRAIINNLLFRIKIKILDLLNIDWHY
ncbi:MAG: hypothetical protein GF311_25820 [Candidatus Lokiarchaeota archaeon]|nr:hypothetical protein [Candidatus Lokiarchaeota archaeon]